MTHSPWMSAARDAICLSLGRPTSSGADWHLAFDVARAERLLGVAWLRSGPHIRAAAPAGVVSAWRAAALAQDARARGQLETLVELSELLTPHGIRPTVLKGPPLSVRLYDELGARQSVDVDVLVPETHREPTRQLLEANGWVHWLGRAPWDECFYRRHGESAEYLEVHSRLPGEALSHCGPLRLERETFAWGAARLEIASGEGFAVYLAGNLTKHGVLPIAALVDFRTLWSLASGSERGAIVKSAHAARLSRCLNWVVQQTELLFEAADGGEGALAKLGVGHSGRVFEHVFLRLARVADSPSDVLRVAAAWVWPRPSRDSWRSFARVWSRRWGKSWSDVGTFRQGYVRS